MSDSDKNILITPNKGSSTDDPKIVFSGANSTTGPQDLTLRVYPTNSGTLSVEGSAGQLFSITNSLSGTIFSVNDVSGIPSIEVIDDGTVKLAEFGGNVLVGTGTNNGDDKLQIAGPVRSTGLSTSPQSITVSSGTTNLNLSLADHWHLTLGANTTFTISNASKKIGSSGIIILKQNGTGGWQFTKSSEMKTPLGGAAISQVTTANSISILTYYVFDSSTLLVNYIGNFA